MKASSASAWLMKASPCIRTTSFGDHVASHTSFEECVNGFSCPLRIIYDHELILYRDCRCSVEFEDGEIVCEPGSFIIIPPGKWHSEVCLETHGGYRYWCHFDWLFHEIRPNSPIMTFAANKPSYELCRPAPDFVPLEILHGQIRKPESVYELASRLKSLMVQGTHHERMLAGTVLHELLIELLDAPFSAGDAGPKESNDMPLASRIRKVLDLAAAQPEGKLSMKERLASFNCSYEHLCRIFKGTYGVGPLHYVQSQRMTKAKALLKSSRLSIAEVCYSVGMSSPAYFAKTFRAIVGKTPSEYRSLGSI